MKHKVGARLPEEVSITSDMQMTPPIWQKSKCLLMKVKVESEKANLKSAFKKLRSWHPAPSLHGK